MRVARHSQKKVVLASDNDKTGKQMQKEVSSMAIHQQVKV
jgi:hypothetical protein